MELDVEESERQAQDRAHDLDADAPVGEEEGQLGRGGANGPDGPQQTSLDVGTGPEVLLTAGMPPVDPSTSPAPGGQQAGGAGSGDSPGMSRELEDATEARCRRQEPGMGIPATLARVTPNPPRAAGARWCQRGP